MKINIVKYCGALLIYYLCVTIVAGSNNLKIFKNVDGLVMEVPFEVQVPKGANLTLICQIENIKSKGIVNGQAAWFIPPKIHSELKLRALSKSSNVVFNNVNTNDEGLYVCASLKFKIFKTLLLLVKQSKPTELNYVNFPRLIKREVIPGNGLYDFNATDPYYDHRSLLELINKNKAMHEDILKDIQNTNKFKDNVLNNDFGYNQDLVYNNNDIYFNNHNESNTNSFPVKTVVLIFGVLFAAFVIILLIRICKYQFRNSSINRNNRQQNIYNPEVTVPTSNISNDAMDIEGPLIHNTLNLTTQLDLPPTYSSSTHNSTQNLNEATNGFNKTTLNTPNSNNFNLPPSYDEAIGLKDDNHNAIVGHNHNGNRSYEHNHGVDNSHVHHSIADGISGNDVSGGGGDSGEGGGGDSGVGGGGDTGGGGDSGGGGGSD